MYRIIVDCQYISVIVYYNADSIRYFTGLESLRTFTESVVFWIVALNRQIVNTRLDRPLKPGIRNKTLRIVLRFQI